jgi:hypothetical protein
MKLSIAKNHLISKVVFCLFFAAAATSCKREPQPSGSEVKTQSSEVKTQSSEVKTQSSEVKTQSSEVKTQSSEVKDLPSEMQLYLIQTDIERSCCPLVSDKNGYLICIKKAIKKRCVNDYLAVVEEFTRRATSHGKAFSQWICGNNVRVE